MRCVFVKELHNVVLTNAKPLALNTMGPEVPVRLAFYVLIYDGKNF